MKAAFRENCIRLGCSIHYVNKQVEHGFTSTEIDKKPMKCEVIQKLFGHVKKIATHVRRCHAQTKLTRKVQVYSDTRFNGAFYMMNVFLEVYDELAAVVNNNYMDDLTSVDKDLLEQLCDFLKLFDESTEHLSDDNRSTIHKVIPIRQLLLNHCEIQSDDNDALKQLKTFLGERIRLVWILQDQHYMSTLLHPLLKHFQIAPNKKDKAIRLMKEELLKRTPVVDVTSANTTSSSILRTTNTAANTTSKDLLARCFDLPQPIVKSVPMPTNELNDYMALDVQLDEKDDILIFWKEHAKRFPILASIVCFDSKFYFQRDILRPETGMAIVTRHDEIRRGALRFVFWTDY
ncbi:unnamed protein product [Didymodactylos carnosus]|uniref:Uncharacterized protein n=2 Tax=Didymodactylos carnosus TaxID=1234261 RepID=A0A8S2H4R7_9BILA|nr:unnamed protein product [Didymodactylos carnosus]CAF3596210.1 unnamed protein product [Didymodactylos carnosus]